MYVKFYKNCDHTGKISTRNAKEYRSINVHQMSKTLPKRSLRDFLSLRHPNHLILATDSSRPLFKQSRFFLAYWLYISTVSIYARVTRVPPRDFAFWAKSIRGQLFWYKIFVHGKSKLLNVLVDFVLICRAICFSKVRFSLAFYRRKLVFFPWNLAWNSLNTVEAQIY